jgi:hypothetical protein
LEESFPGLLTTLFLTVRRPNLDWTSKTHLAISILPTISSPFTSQTFSSKNNQNFNLKNHLITSHLKKKKWEWKKIWHWLSMREPWGKKRELSKRLWSSFDFSLEQIFANSFRDFCSLSDCPNYTCFQLNDWSGFSVTLTESLWYRDLNYEMTDWKNHFRGILRKIGNLKYNQWNSFYKDWILNNWNTRIMLIHHR